MSGVKRQSSSAPWVSATGQTVASTTIGAGRSLAKVGSVHCVSHPHVCGVGVGESSPSESRSVGQAPQVSRVSVAVGSEAIAVAAPVQQHSSGATTTAVITSSGKKSRGYLTSRLYPRDRAFGTR